MSAELKLDKLQGQVNPTGDLVCLSLTRGDGKALSVDLSNVNVQSLLTLLLLMSDEAARLSGDFTQRPPTGPIPLHAVSVGELSNGDPCLSLSVGVVTLAFWLSPDGARSLGETLLACSAAHGGRH